MVKPYPGGGGGSNFFQGGGGQRLITIETYRFCGFFFRRGSPSGSDHMTVTREALLWYSEIGLPGYK